MSYIPPTTEGWTSQKFGTNPGGYNPAAPHIAAQAWEAGREVGLAQDFEATTQITNPHEGSQ